MAMQKSFNSGELSRQVWGRPDLVKFGSGARTMRNIVCLSHGPAYRRSGSIYTEDVEDHAVKGLLYGFEFSYTQAYMIEFADLKIRFFKDGGIILDGGSPYELVSPYSEADLPDLDFAPIGDTIYISHPDYNTRALVRFDHNLWTISESAHDDGPFLKENTTSTTMTPSIPGTGTPWDLSSAVYSQEIALGIAGLFFDGLSFSSDGTKLYLVTGGSAHTVRQYTLSTAWDISTASYLQLFDVSAQALQARGLFFKDDGLKMYIVDDFTSTIFQYTLGTAWDISTASYATKSFSVSSQTNYPQDIQLSSDGTKAFIVSYSTSKAVYQYTLSTAWDISTAAYASKTVDISGQLLMLYLKII